MSARYQSPFSWRYGSDAMRALFSEETKRRMWRRMWFAIAQAQSKAGLISQDELGDLRRHIDDVDIQAANAVERELQHDLMAELAVYAGQCTVGGGKLHLGATSMDIEDNVETARMKSALGLVRAAIRRALDAFASSIERYAGMTCMAFTHLQAAEPTTLGYRMSLWAQDVYFDYENLKCVADWLPAKGLRGAVGTSASYHALLDGGTMTVETLERDVLERFGLRALTVAGQTYPRRLDYIVLSALAAFAASCSKVALDVRVLASTPFGELGEPFGSKQVGSSAMPFKRNPILSERVCSLARLVAANANVAWQNAADNALERTLDDSANRRIIIPESFLAAEELADLITRIISGLRVDERRVAANLATYGPFAATEAVLMAAVKGGADRQKVHECLRIASMQAWEAIGKGEHNPLPELLAHDPDIVRFVPADALAKMMDPTRHVGLAPARAGEVAKLLRALGPEAAPSVIADLQLA